MDTIKIIILEGNAVFFNVMKSFFENETCFEIIGESHNANVFMQLNNIENADVVFIDIDLDLDNHNGNGFVAAMHVMMNYPKTKVVAVCNVKKYYLEKMLHKLGFTGIIGKPSFYADILQIMKLLVYKELKYDE